MRVYVIVAGKVQGVFYRAETKNMADQLGIRGWVKNRSDGKVEAVFEGPEDLVLEMLDWCKQGPRGAEVSKVSDVPEVSKEKFEGFEIRY